MPTVGRVELIDRITNLSDALNTARLDFALLSRLKNAEADVARLTTELEAAQAQLPGVIADEVLAKREAAYAGIESVSVTDKTPGDSVLHSAFVITVTRLAYNERQQSVMQTQAFSGFDAVPVEVINYLLEKQPSQMPAKIAALAPTIDDAYFRCFVGKRRGYLTQAV